MGRRRWIVLALGGIVVLAAAALLVLGEGDEGVHGPSDGPAGSSAVRGEQSHREPGHALELLRRGDPLVWVKRGESTSLRSAPGGEVVRRLGHRTEFGSPRVLAVERTRGRWAGVLTPDRANGELGWVRLDARRLRAGYTTSTVLVDISEREAVVRRSGRALRRFPVTVGAPSSPTPVGRFAVTDTFKGGLSPAYGCCAVATTAKQPHLPSGWLGGDRIAFHGTTGEIGVAASHGCIRAADRDVEPLLEELPLGSRVEIRN